MEIVSILAYIAIGILVINVILAGFVVFFERRNPASSWAWLFVLLFIPVFGFVIYMIFGRNSKREKMFRVNVLGTIYLSKFTALQMAARKRGAIINIASMAGKIATPKSSVYSATKAAVLGYSDALRLELKPLGISVMTVNPGPIRTKFFDKADKSGNYLEKINGIVLNPELVAEKIVHSIGTAKRELNLPFFFNIANVGYTLFPRLGDFLAAGIFNQK